MSIVSWTFILTQPKKIVAKRTNCLEVRFRTRLEKASDDEFPQDYLIAHGFKPIYMFNGYGEITAPYHQLVTMVCLLRSSGLTKGTDYNYITLPGTLHSFHYWGSWDHQPGAVRSTVSDDVIAFLKTQAGLP